MAPTVNFLSVILNIYYYMLTDAERMKGGSMAFGCIILTAFIALSYGFKLASFNKDKFYFERC